MTYRLLDSGSGRKLEEFGPVVVDRPSPYAIWEEQNRSLWTSADLYFTRERGWRGSKDSWKFCTQDLTFT